MDVINKSKDAVVTYVLVLFDTPNQNFPLFPLGGFCSCSVDWPGVPAGFKPLLLNSDEPRVGATGAVDFDEPPNERLRKSPWPVDGLKNDDDIPLWGADPRTVEGAPKEITSSGISISKLLNKTMNTFDPGI